MSVEEILAGKKLLEPIVSFPCFPSYFCALLPHRVLFCWSHAFDAEAESGYKGLCFHASPQHGGAGMTRAQRTGNAVITPDSLTLDLLCIDETTRSQIQLVLFVYSLG